MPRGTEGARLASYYLASADPRTPYASPLYADPTGLPPTLIQVGSDEILLDDSVRMAERMRAAGCQGRTRNMAANAAHLAGLGAGPSGSASGH